MNIVRQNGKVLTATDLPFLLHDALVETPDGPQGETCRIHLGAGPCSHNFQLDKPGVYPGGTDGEEEAIERRASYQRDRYGAFRDHAFSQAMDEGATKTDDEDFIYTFRMSRIRALEAELYNLDKRIQAGEIIPAVIVNPARAL